MVVPGRNAGLLLLVLAFASISAADCPRSDLNADCRVGFEDLRMLAEQWLDVRQYADVQLVGRWSMDSGPALVVADDSGNGRDGELVHMDMGAWVGGRFGGALEFDGTDDYVQITGYKGVLHGDPRTICAWIKTTAVYKEIVTWGYKGIPGARWVVCVNQQGQLSVEVGNGGAVGTLAVSDGKWHHVAITSETATTDGIRIYVDGVLDPISACGPQTIDTAETDDVKIGVHLGTVRYFAGVIDDVRIYDRRLSDEEIAQLGAPNADLDESGRVDMADLGLLSSQWLSKGSPRVIINEIHYDPDVKTELVEFVELYNGGEVSADLSGWYFSAGFDLLFADGTTIAPGGYLVVAQNAVAFRQKFGFDADAVFTGKLDNDGETVRLRDASGDTVDAVDYQLGFPWPTVGDAVPTTQPGTGRSIQLINDKLDNDLGGNWRSGVPTPRAANSVRAGNSAPQMRQLSHSPQSPRGNEAVTITVKVTDPEGVDSVSLSYQVVSPGNYVRLTDAAYGTNWTSVPMHDDGQNGDVLAGDDVYTCVLSASMQVHRRLVRYRITARDRLGLSITAPYADDPCPNFAYFVYDGVPAWSGAIEPGSGDPVRGQVVTYGPEVMRSLPVYHLISSRSEVEASTWGGYTGSDYLWYGTLVYDGEVYDHIRHRARGGVWRYAMGKNMWKFDFNRGHYFQARDDYGNKYDTKWDKLNFSACIQQGNYWHRGEQGMFEAAGFRLFNMMGCPASKTNWLQFRIIDDAAESGPSQYDGDFWGLYMTIEQLDGRFLDEHELPDGNMYKIEGHVPDGNEKNNQGATAVADMSDFYTFKSGYYNDPNPTEAWWLANVNLDCYYGYRCVVEGIHHGDIGYGKNYVFYLNPETSLWYQLPWDLDLTWANNMYGNGEDPFKNEGAIFSNVNLRRAYDNRLREFLDLLYNPDQMNQLIDEYAAVIDDPAGGLSIVDADRAMWDYNPIMTTRTHSDKGGVGRFYQQAATKDFRGMVQIMKDYVTGYRAFNSYSEDPAIPRTPQVTYIGAPNYPVNDLSFSTSAFSDPQGAGTFAAMKWRIAEVAPFSTNTQPGGPITVIPAQSKWRYFKGTEEASLPDTTAWREYGFNDSGWSEGYAPIGWGESSSFLGTTLDGMQWTYTSFYVRKKFTISDLDGVGKATLSVMYDDGFNVWINDTYLPSASDNMPGENVAYNGVANGNHNNEASWFTFNVPVSCLVEGENIIAIQVQNFSRTNSSDCFVDASLTVEPAAEEPPPVPPNYYRRPGKYEIDAVWESRELSQFQDTIRIPAGPVRPGHTYRVRVRMKDNTNRWSHWSGPIQFVAGEPLGGGLLESLRITEVMYNPASGGGYDNDEYEFIELKNVGDDPQALDLSNVSFTNGITFDFASGAVRSLGAGEFVLVVRNRAAFESRYGTSLSGRIAGQYATAQNDQKLANDGETLRLEDLYSGPIADFEYGDGRGWPLSADGGGHSLVPLDAALAGQPDGSANYCGNWRASAFIGGSPGADDPSPANDVVINEVMAHTDYFDPARPEYDSNDWIELYNRAGSAVALGGDWYLSDDIDDLRKWPLPSTDLPAGGCVSFDEVSGFHNPITSGFGLNKKGEQIFLSYLPGDGTDRVADCVTFKGQENDVSSGRYPDGGPYWFALTPTRDGANTGPLRSIVISEVMYHPADNKDEYIELYNPTSQRVDLYTTQGPWRLDGGVSYTFPAGRSLGAGQRLLVVPFDPAMDAEALAQFLTDYGDRPLTPGVNLFGPYDGNLSNAAERVALERSEAPDLPDPDVPWVIVDEVIYGDYDPWPRTADGEGDAIHRLSAAASASGNDPGNWLGAAPSPRY